MFAAMVYLENLETCEPVLNHQVKAKTILESCQRVYSPLDKLYIVKAQLTDPKPSSQTEQN